MNNLKNEYSKNIAYWSDRLETTVNFAKSYSEDTLLALLENEMEALFFNLRSYAFASTFRWSQE